MAAWRKPDLWDQELERTGARAGMGPLQRQIHNLMLKHAARARGLAAAAEPDGASASSVPSEARDDGAGLAKASSPPKRAGSETGPR